MTWLWLNLSDLNVAKLEKRRAYEERVREIEHGCFTPLVFSTAGGMGKAATVAYKRLAHLLSTRRDTP